MFLTFFKAVIRKGSGKTEAGERSGRVKVEEEGQTFPRSTAGGTAGGRSPEVDRNSLVVLHVINYLTNSSLT
jgi:hypothetical protein